MMEPTVPGTGWTPEWQPGDELYSRSSHAYSLYVFNFRDDSESATCACSDAASWPLPAAGKTIEDDLLAGFIAEWRSWQEAAS